MWQDCVVLFRDAQDLRLQVSTSPPRRFRFNGLDAESLVTFATSGAFLVLAHSAWGADIRKANNIHRAGEHTFSMLTLLSNVLYGGSSFDVPLDETFHLLEHLPVALTQPILRQHKHRWRSTLQRHLSFLPHELAALVAEAVL